MAHCCCSSGQHIIFSRHKRTREFGTRLNKSHIGFVFNCICILQHLLILLQYKVLGLVTVGVTPVVLMLCSEACKLVTEAALRSHLINRLLNWILHIHKKPNWTQLNVSAQRQCVEKMCIIEFLEENSRKDKAAFYLTKKNLWKMIKYKCEWMREKS